MSRPVVNPGVVSWAGDHLLLSLRPPGAVEDTTLVSFYRTHYSPAGAGHVALVLSDANVVGRGADDVRAIFTDNRPLTQWVRHHLVRTSNHPFREASLPILAARFEASGMVGQRRVETIRAEQNLITLTWSDFEPPLYFEGPRGTLGPSYDIFSLLFPAATASVTINSRSVSGQPYLREIWRASTGRDLSSSLIAIGEVLIEQPEEPAIGEAR